jgi:hypothetical protein
MLGLFVALHVAAGGHALDWAAATRELELLQGLTPAAADFPKAPFIKLGGSCWQPGADGRVTLGDGNENGHTWHWTLVVRVRKGVITLTGPSLKHAVNRKGDKRHFDDKGQERKLAIGPAVDDVWPLYAELHQLELSCGQVDESSAVCGGKQKTCRRCSTVQLVGGPRPGLHQYALGLVHPAAEESCDNLCTGPGLSWSDFEALAQVVNRTPVVDTTVAPVAQMFEARAACEAAKFDFDPAFKPLEPDIPRLAR